MYTNIVVPSMMWKEVVVYGELVVYRALHIIEECV